MAIKSKKVKETNFFEQTVKKFDFINPYIVAIKNFFHFLATLLPQRIEKRYYIGNFSPPTKGVQSFYSMKDEWLFGNKWYPFWIRRLIYDILGLGVVIFLFLFVITSAISMISGIPVDTTNVQSLQQFFATSAQVIAAAIAIPFTIIFVVVQIRFSQLGDHALNIVTRNKLLLFYLLFSIFALVASVSFLVFPSDGSKDLIAKIIVLADNVVFIGLFFVILTITSLYKPTGISDYFRLAIYNGIRKKEIPVVYDLITTIRNYYLSEIRSGNVNNIRWVNQLASDFLKDYIWFPKYYHARIEGSEFTSKYGYSNRWFEEQLVRTLIEGQQTAIQNQQFEIAADINRAIVSVLYEVVNFPEEMTENKERLFSQFGRGIAEFSKLSIQYPANLDSNWRLLAEHICSAKSPFCDIMLNSLIRYQDLRVFGNYPYNLLVFPQIVEVVLKVPPFTPISNENLVTLLDCLKNYNNSVEKIMSDDSIIDTDIYPITNRNEMHLFLLVLYLWDNNRAVRKKLNDSFPKDWRNRALINLKNYIRNDSDSPIIEIAEQLFAVYKRNKRQTFIVEDFLQKCENFAIG